MESKELLFRAFSTFDRAGLHLIPKHYYTPVPDCTWLQRHRQLWAGRSSLTGIPWNLAAQSDWLERTCRPYYHEVAGLQTYNSFMHDGAGPGYGPIESQVLHCFIRAYAPGRVLEIGSGVSTMCMLEAARLNLHEGQRVPEITCVEPYPRASLLRSKEIQLVPQLCQETPLSLFKQLSAGDLLFIDSTHAVKIGSDVIRIYLEIIPSLAPGIFIQIHDIFLPYAYPRNVFTRPFWWEETALLIALLTNNPKLSVLACLSALHYDNADKMRRLLTDYRPAPNNEGLSVNGRDAGHFPCSIWLQTA